MSKIQFLKAIHNNNRTWILNESVVYDVKDTIFESNSQLKPYRCFDGYGCLRCQRYNFWKQFTTHGLYLFNFWWLFTMSKIQFLKAIHNLVNINGMCWVVVYDVKDTIFESNSQQVAVWSLHNLCCLRCQRYNFWKQFTTLNERNISVHALFTMSKIQFLKAIHNRFGA